jgi:cellulase/cellobiase CelA1
MGQEACADPVAGVGLTAPLVELTGRVAFQHRTGSAAGSDTRAGGERLSAGAIAVIADEYGEVLPGGATSGVEFTLIETTVWPTGFCSDATVTNTTTEPVTWEARAEIAGEITSIWSANYTVDGDDHVFTGVEWNSELPAFGSTTFGFCGAR